MDHDLGFTTLELIMVIAVIAVLVGLAAPSFREILMNARMTGQTNDLMADLALARAEAVKRNVATFVCTSDNRTTCTGSAWNAGWLVVADANNDRNPDSADIVIKSTPALQGENTITVTNDANAGGIRHVPYHPSGAARPGASVVFTMCDARSTNDVGASSAHLKGRRLIISPTGRAAVERWTC
jgi:type IV fimbrial biogenesis protein FimT